MTNQPPEDSESPDPDDGVLVFDDPVLGVLDERVLGADPTHPRAKQAGGDDT